MKKIKRILKNITKIFNLFTGDKDTIKVGSRNGNLQEKGVKIMKMKRIFS